MKCTQPQDKADRMFNPRTQDLKADRDTIKAAGKHDCMEPVSPESKEWLWVHEDCAYREGLKY